MLSRPTLLHPENQLISSLPRADRSRLLGVCEPVQLQLSQVLCEAGQATRHVYFPTESFISLIAEVDDHHGLEVGMAGREGMLGVHLALGVARDPLKALVQGAGAAWRVGAAPFRRELARSAALRNRLQRYLYVLMEQRAQSAACLRFHEIGPRLSRWLLMSQDRAHCDQFPMTQEFVATMLGVRRAACGRDRGRGRLAAPGPDRIPPRCAHGAGPPWPGGRIVQLLRERGARLCADHGQHGARGPLILLRARPAPQGVWRAGPCAVLTAATPQPGVPGWHRHPPWCPRASSARSCLRQCRRP